jgi:hypothetical protein
LLSTSSLSRSSSFLLSLSPSVFIFSLFFSSNVFSLLFLTLLHLLHSFLGTKERFELRSL